MDIADTFDITAVCNDLGITSRTLRYYEEIGLIESTKSNYSKRRRYTKDQIEKIQYILTLRSIGLSMKAIQECLNGDKSIKDIVNLHRAQIEASIYEKLNEVHLLNIVLDSLAEGQELGAIHKHNEQAEGGCKADFTRECSMYIVTGELDCLYSYFSQRMKDYMPQEAFRKIWEDTIAGLGDYIGLGETTQDTITNDTYEIYYQVLIFKKMKIQLKFVYNDKTIVGLWMKYMGGGK